MNIIEQDELTYTIEFADSDERLTFNQQMYDLRAYLMHDESKALPPQNLAFWSMPVTVSNAASTKTLEWVETKDRSINVTPIIALMQSALLVDKPSLFVEEIKALDTLSSSECEELREIMLSIPDPEGDGIRLWLGDEAKREAKRKLANTEA